MLKQFFYTGFIIGMLCANVIAQDSLNMERIGQFNPPNMPIKSGVTYNDVWGYTASEGSEYAILGNVDSILVVDISDPTLPIREYGFYGGNRTIWRDFKTYGDYMYGVCDNCNEGLHIFDMSALPSGNITHVATIDTFFTRAHNIYIDTSTQKLYAAGSNTAVEGLVVIDITTPNIPVRLAEIEFDDEIGQPSANFYVHDVYVKNDTAYCSHGYKGYYVWDMRDLNNIELLGDYNSPGYNHSSWNNDAGDYAYYAEEVPTGQPLAVIDLANLGHPVNDIQLVTTFKDPISNTSTDVTPHNPFVKNDTMYLSYYEDGMKVYDLSNPEAPDMIAYYDTYPDNGGSYNGYNGAWGSYPFFASGNLLISDIKYGLNIIKVQQCASPTTYYKDADGDGYGDYNIFETSCSEPNGYVINNSDCDDDDDASYPGAPELCDGKDNDCDGLTDQNDPDVVYNTYYLDNDNDGYGDASMTTLACLPPTGYVIDDTDCDDSNNMINPGFPEICDGLDNDCDGLVDGADADLTSIEWYEDFDSDGYGKDNVTLYQCAQPAGYVAFPSDCDDLDANNYPTNTEVCDGQDNNCDGIVDEGCNQVACDAISLYINPIVQNAYHVKQDISSDATVLSTEDIKFFAGNHIDLTSQFEVKSGGVFLADILDCDDTGLSIIDINPGEVSYFLIFLKDHYNKDDEINVVYTDEFGDKMPFNNISTLTNWLKLHYFNGCEIQVID
ncbi:MAG: choice-of-anchor B family protein [Saprospiraceae bacterium]|nr:choice-of-anchor B family protein [Bacteroidia bacterium]NNL92419.1 choice-of-anchor B family protein [Saprospiraceae bacterium]